MQQVSRTSTKLAGLVGLLALTAVGTPAFALPVYDTNVLSPDFTGSRTENSGQLITGGVSYPTDGLNYTVGWAITQTGSTFNYRYTFSNFGGQGAAISHIIIDLSDNCVPGNAGNSGCEYNAKMNGTAVTGSRDAYNATSQGNSNPNLLGEIIGVKYNRPTSVVGTGTVVLAFDSERAPVWGDVYVAGGGNPRNFMRNAGNTLHGTSADKLQFIARPDTQTSTVPEPASLLLLGSGLVAMGLVRRKK